MLSIKPCLAQKEEDQPPIDPTTKDYKYEDVVDLKDNASKGELYKRAKAAIMSLFKSESNIIQSEDTAEGFIIAKVYSEMPDVVFTGGNAHNAKLLFTFTIQLKNGRFRYVIDNLQYKFDLTLYSTSTKAGGAPMNSAHETALIKLEGAKKQRNQILGDANSTIKSKISAFKIAMNSGNSGNLKKDW